jgi:hypothetical protein
MVTRKQEIGVGAEENIWTQRRTISGGWKELQNEEFHNVKNTILLGKLKKE